MEKGRTETPLIKAQQVKRYAAAEPVHRRCNQCGEEMEGRHQNFSYTQCGLSNVVLMGVLVFNCRCGEIAVEIPSISDLHRFIAFELLRKPTLLSGEEIRYLRKFLGYTAAAFADKIGMTNISVSRWERGSRITKSMDRALRLAFFAAMMEQDAKTVLGVQSELNIPSLVEFAKRVDSFNLMAFLNTIRDEVKRRVIKVDPIALREFGRSEAVLRQDTSKLLQ